MGNDCRDVHSPYGCVYGVLLNPVSSGINPTHFYGANMTQGVNEYKTTINNPK